MHIKTSPRIGLAAALITVTVWTGFIVIARASASHTLNAFDIVWCRFVGAGLCLLPVGVWMARQARAEGRAVNGWLGLSPLPFKQTAVIGCIAGLGYSMLAYSGFFFAPAGHASVLMPGSLPLWTALLSVLLLGERLGRARWAALALIVAGDLTVGGASMLKAFSGGEVWKGDVLFMSAAATWALYTVTARRWRLDAVQATAAISVFCLLSYVPLYGLLAATGAVASKLSLAPWGEIAAQMLLQGIGSVVISGISFTVMVQHYGPVRTTMFTSIVPASSALAAVFFLGEPLGLNLLLGLALVTAGILLGVLAARPAQAVAGTTKAPA
jgi:drug/metabolite transporter (DMT)-like permease